VQIDLGSSFENTDVSIITHSNAVLGDAHQALIDAFVKEAAEMDSIL
jgi:hypothetical protein